MTTVPAQPRAGDLALPSFSNQPARATEPLVGVSCRVLSEAARRVAAQVREEAGADGDMEIVAAVLAAIALAADRGRARYVSELVPREIGRASCRERVGISGPAKSDAATDARQFGTQKHERSDEI